MSSRLWCARYRGFNEGSLGHGMGLACGIAHAYKIKKIIEWYM